MSNIAMCKHSDCEKSSSCLRFLDTPSENQAYVKFQNICPNKDYQWYWETETELAKVDNKEEMENEN